MTPAFADDISFGGSFSDIKKAYAMLCRLGDAYGYFPQPDKSIMITPTANQASASVVFQPEGFSILSGHRYLGGFIGEADAFLPWIKAKVERWAQSISQLSNACLRFPQSAYCGLQKSLRHEWQFVQRVKACDSELFSPLEQALATEFWPMLLGRQAHHNPSQS